MPRPFTVHCSPKSRFLLLPMHQVIRPFIARMMGLARLARLARLANRTAVMN